MNWQPIETAPKDGRNILVRYHLFLEEYYITEAWYCEEDDEILKADGNEVIHATHWMPRPPDPATQPTTTTKGE